MAPLFSQLLAEHVEDFTAEISGLELIPVLAKCAVAFCTLLRLFEQQLFEPIPLLSRGGNVWIEYGRYQGGLQQQLAFGFLFSGLYKRLLIGNSSIFASHTQAQQGDHYIAIMEGTEFILYLR